MSSGQERAEDRPTILLSLVPVSARVCTVWGRRAERFVIFFTSLPLLSGTIKLS